MVKHIVCFKLADPTPENCEKAAEVLRSMRGNVEQIVDMDVGVDFLRSPRSYDVFLSVTVADRAALEAYQRQQYHCDVVKTHMHAVCCASVALDYEI